LHEIDLSGHLSTLASNADDPTIHYTITPLSDDELALAVSKWLLDGEDSVSEGRDLVLQHPPPGGGGVDDEMCAVRPNRRDLVNSLQSELVHTCVHPLHSTWKCTTSTK
jgi:hypothetical protein